MWLACNGEGPAEENEVSERGFKLTLAVVGFAAAVGQWDRSVRFRDLCLLDGQPQSYRAMEENHVGRLLQASATLRDGGESALGSRLNLL